MPVDVCALMGSRPCGSHDSLIFFESATRPAPARPTPTRPAPTRPTPTRPTPLQTKAEDVSACRPTPLQTKAEDVPACGQADPHQVARLDGSAAAGNLGMVTAGMVTKASVGDAAAAGNLGMVTQATNDGSTAAVAGVSGVATSEGSVLYLWPAIPVFQVVNTV